MIFLMLRKETSMKKQKEEIKKFIRKHGHLLCSLAILAAINMDGSCKILLYDPKEPEGFGTFLDKNRKNI